MSKNLSELSGRKGLMDNLFEGYGRAAEVEQGSPSQESLDKLAEDFLVGKAVTHGVTSFYDFLKPENKGKKAYYCNGSACLCAGTQNEVKQTLEGHFGADAVGHMTCLGRCHENGAFHIDGVNYSGLDKGQLESLLKSPEIKDDDYKVKAHGQTVLTSSDYGLERCSEILKAAWTRPSDEILGEIRESGIRGRGGAGFPMHIKLSGCQAAEGDTKFLICNADEGDPGAYTDRYLLERRPYALLTGMVLAAYAAGIEHGVVYIRAEYPDSVRIIRESIEAMREAGVLGKSLVGDWSFDFKVIQAQGAYICGEETALINSIEGQRPEVRIRPPYPVTHGLFGKPTVVNNVETLAAVPWIVSNGGEQYAKIGTGKSTGTKLLSIDGGFNNPGVYEVDMGTPLSAVVEELGGGFRLPVKAMQIGGPLGGIVPVSEIDNLTVDFESFQQSGFLLGHASVVTIPEVFPMLEYLEHLFEFASYESCGKCFPCRLGTKRAEELFRGARTKGDKIDSVLLDDLLHTLETGSLCAHGGGIPLPVRNALHYFRDELSVYIEQEESTTV